MNYPFLNSKINDKENINNYKNRGLSFESMINDSNEYYLKNNIFIILFHNSNYILLIHGFIFNPICCIFP